MDSMPDSIFLLGFDYMKDERYPVVSLKAE